MASPSHYGLSPPYLKLQGCLATFVHPNHIVSLCSGDSLTCRLPATPSWLGISCFLSVTSWFDALQSAATSAHRPALARSQNLPQPQTASLPRSST
ncbi:hypothetical protein FHO46_03230 [Vibrio cholerae]|nr:hypothetical protein [Vibrio cholerae]EGR0363782.1 hypothetical protein [Vibrio cholerae]EGR0605983.1 hypothetical protein [Vibrio cholerae]TQQ32753.1 hypothetical protein FLL66_06850 [Vibrio cholerae]TXY90092.1 hypothetical protein FXE72_10855 [Vibrio cholerae]